MAEKIRAVVITGNGTNCEREVAHACRLAGAEVSDIVHIAELLTGRVRLDDYHLLNLAGGFLDGDDLGSAKAAANRFLHAPVRESEEHLSDQLQRFIAEGKLVMGVCNGFQLMIKMGLLPGLGGDRRQTATLTHNDSGRFEDRWCYLKVDPQSPCIYTRDIEGVYLPVRHGEGKFVTEGREILDAIQARHLAPLQYSDPSYLGPSMIYPDNPNGSEEAIAAICDETGRLFGMMPHPERAVEEVLNSADGLKLFESLKAYYTKKAAV